MDVSDHRVVSIHYTLCDSRQNVIDSSSEGEPLAYIHGTGSIIPGLETALEGKSAGDDLKVAIPSHDAYGERRDDLVHVVERDRLQSGDREIEIGTMFRIQTEQAPGADEPDQVVRFTVTNIDGDQITLDANHPLAGMTLHFQVSVVDVREATEEELAHGHVHGPGGHDHGDAEAETEADAEAEANDPRASD